MKTLTMDTRADFQRLLEEMDNVIKTKQQELFELDERLETARKQLAEKEASELKNYESLADSGGLSTTEDTLSEKQRNAYIQEQRALYELQLERFGEELSELEIINQKLAKENDSLRSELDEREEIVEKLKYKCKQLVDSLDEVHGANLELNLRLASAESEMQMQQRLLKKSHEEDEVLMGAFNDKLESLNKAIEWRDEEIKRLRSDNQFALEHFGIDFNQDDKRNEVFEPYHLIGNLPDSNNKQRVIEIASAFREKDTQLELLKSQLLQATKDLERNAAIIEKLAQHRSNQRQQASGLDTDDHYSSLTGCDPLLCTKAERELVARYKILENELESKDRQLNALEVKNYHYETILPNMISGLVCELAQSRRGSELTEGDTQSMKKIEELSDNLNRLLNELNTGQVLLGEIDHLKRLNEEKGLRIELLVQQLNQLDAKFSSSQQQSDDPVLDSHNAVRLKSVPNVQVSLADNQSKRDLSEYDIQLEVISSTHSNLQASEGSDLNEHASNVNKKNAAECQELDYNNNNDSESNNNEGRTNEQSINTKSSADTKDRADCSTIDSSATTSNKFIESSTGCESKRSIKQLVQPSIKARTRFGKSTSISTDTIDTVLKLKNRLRQLESENELLELAMKEILLSIKWSDAQCSTILIDCPSLERLCQLIEARFLSKPMPARSKEDDYRLSQEPLEAPSDDRQWCGAGGLFQLIVMKSELDLLRGQNEQLRADIKTHRREYQELLITSSGRPHVEMVHAETSTESVGISGNPHDNQPVSELDPKSDSESESQRLIDAECQTEQEPESKTSEKLIEEDRFESMVVSISNSDHQGEVKRDVSSKCHNCTRLVRLANHLLQCIVRVETRVHVSEETFMSRLISLHSLIHVLDRDISVRENLLNNSRRECHLLRQEKCLAEARLHFLEVQLSTHMKSCPVSHLSSDVTIAKDTKVYSTIENAKEGEFIESLTMSKSYDGSLGEFNQVELPLLKNARMTITLLQSIINCLQARLDYKDERLQYLEGLLSEETISRSSTAGIRLRDASRIVVNS